MNMAVLAILGSLIILGLAVYAGYLLLKLRKQKVLIEKHKRLAIEKRNANIFSNVDTLCMVGIQGQCDLSEISIRVYCIMDYVQGEQWVDFEKEFPAICELYHTVKEMARGKARLALPKRERMQQNMVRITAESRLSDAIIDELKLLRERIQPMNQQISVQVI
jgi:hypothetical protein